MATRMLLLIALTFAPAHAVVSKVAPISLASSEVESASLTVAEMESVFARSEEAHQYSLKKISKSLTMPKAMQILQSMQNVSAFEEVTSLIAGGQSGAKTSLRKGKKAPGYSGIDGARKMLNEMIFESLKKYDEEIEKCTDFYSKQCALMETARGGISAANFVAANSRALILDAQAQINLCEVSIPETKQELKDHNLKCANEKRKLNARLKIVMGDIEVMAMILRMTDCEKAFVQQRKFMMLKCKNKCTKNTVVSFNHKDLQHQVSQLQSSVTLSLFQSSLDDMFDENAPMQSVQLMQFDDSGFQVPNKTKFDNPPVPKTVMPGNPCKDPYAGAPSAEDKRAAKCTIKKSPQCYKLQSRFLAIQGGIADERDKLLEAIATLEADCEEQKNILETAIANDKQILADSHTKLAAATTKEAQAGETARQINKENTQYNADLVKQMKACSANYITFETELCALKKIRGELYKLKGGGHSAFFQDCDVSKWEPEECTKECAGGMQLLTRTVLNPTDGGTMCLPLQTVKSCNNQPCPVDCKLESWSGWSKCSAKCGGGVTQRLRDVKQAMKHNGKPCGEVNEEKACNIASCEKDCELSRWTAWTSCSKDCNLGTKKRIKIIDVPAEGEGTCPGKWSEERLEYKECNKRECALQPGAKTLKCNHTMDVTILIDECPRSGKEGFAAQIEAATNLVDAFDGPSSDAEFAVIKYCGPRTWSGVKPCTNGRAKDPDKQCKTSVVSHFTGEAKKVKNLLSGLEFAPGTKLVTLALLKAQSELTLGRKNAHSVVVSFIDGPPLSFRKTKLAAHVLRKKARLVFVPVVKFSPLKDIKSWATRRWEENVVDVKTWKEWASPDTVTRIIANICPKEFPKAPKWPKPSPEEMMAEEAEMKEDEMNFEDMPADGGSEMLGL